jgi:hypothetical protein
MTFTSTDPVSHQGKTNTWLTPLSLINSLGSFDLDPCAFPGHKTAIFRFELPKDGLKETWHGRVWLNPPYGKETSLWLHKLKDHGNGIALVFGRLETKWLQPYLDKGFFQIEGRIKFLNDRFEEESNAGAPSILIPFGRKNIGSILSSDLKGKWFQ